ncbi:hypothetical protein [Georgenia sp. H159]|uniref:hypothetical protein n=1 Tax=Georgenia sp. H159 TaxID=3076115 RepID=UPI002D7801D9|nr:hypothetical protein [Georgenia sp. H159]
MTVVLPVLACVLVLAWFPGRVAPLPVGPRLLVRGGQPRWSRRPRRRHPPDLAVVVTEVASRLRTGSSPDVAWAATVERLLGPSGEGGSRRTWATSGAGAGPAPYPDGATWPRHDGAPPDDVPPALARLVRHCAADPGAAVAARTVVAASRLTQSLGAPLAEVLDRCAATVTEAEAARDARRVALAGPRSTARILAGLPLLGLLLGAGLGADPLDAATDGGWGSVSVGLGLVLLAVGWRWTRALVAAAEGAPRLSRRRLRRVVDRWA